jgi:hypothetical protein
MKLSRREFKHVVLYLVSLALISLIVHEVSHVLAALLLGVPFAELELGFYGINPSVTTPAWFSGTPRLVVYYAGGLVPGLMLLCMYLFFWIRRYNRRPSIPNWCFGLVTLELAVLQLAISYLEGSHHSAYIAGAGLLFSSTHILIYGFMISAFFIHRALSPRSKIKEASVNNIIE